MKIFPCQFQESNHTHKQAVLAKRLVVQLVLAQNQFIQVSQPKQTLWSDDSDVVFLEQKIICSAISISNIASGNKKKNHVAKKWLL